MENYYMEQFIPADEDWQKSDYTALIGFEIISVLPPLGPDGITLLFGCYPIIGTQMHVLAVSFDSDTGCMEYDKAVSEFTIDEVIFHGKTRSTEN